MRHTMRWLSLALAIAVMGGVLLGGAPAASAQQRTRVIIIQRSPVFFDPFFPYPYWYYPPAYVAANYGDVKIENHRKNAQVYIDGGYAATINKSKKFTLRPGTHEIELRNSDGHTFFAERVTVTIGQTTKVYAS